MYLGTKARPVKPTSFGLASVMRKLAWTLPLLAVFAACGEDDAAEAPRVLSVNRTLVGNGLRVTVEQATFASAWTDGDKAAQGPAVILSLTVVNESPVIANDGLSRVYLRHPKGGDWSSPVSIPRDAVAPGASVRMELTFPLSKKPSPESLGQFGLAMSGSNWLHHRPFVLFDGPSSPYATPIPLQAGLRIKGQLQFDLTRAELRTDDLCSREQVSEGSMELHLFATITVPPDAPAEPDALEALFFDLEAYNDMGPYFVYGQRCWPQDFTVTRPMVKENVIFTMMVGEQGERPRTITLRYAGAEATLEIPAKAAP